jgi:hypothetical protein
MALLGVAAVSMLAFAATAEAKSKHKKKLGPVLTASATTSGAGNMANLTATATCPKGTRALGGGFLGTPPGVAADGIVYESQKVGQNAWRASSVITDPGPVYESVVLDVFVQCRKGAPATQTATKVSTTSAVASVGQPAVATCPRPKQRALAGGFLSSPPGDPAGFLPTNVVVNSAASGPNAWQSQLFTVTKAADLTGFAYCAKQKKAPVFTSAQSPALASNGSFAKADATCAGKLSPLAGGFTQPGAVISGTGSLFLVYESEPVRNKWRVSGIHLSTETPASLVSSAYCG